MHTEHDAPPNSDVNPEALKQGYEPDNINVRTILYVPVAIVITFVLAYGVVTLIIDSLREGHKAPGDNFPAVARNDAPLNKRLDRISSTDPKAEVKQPRLEGADELTTKVPPYVQSSVPTKEDKKGNSPHYHPEDLRTTSEHAKALGLQDYGWKEKSKDIVHIPILEALKILGQGANDKDPAAKKLFETVLKYEDKVNVEAFRANQPTPSNPQWGIKPAGAAEQPKGGEH